MLKSPASIVPTCFQGGLKAVHQRSLEYLFPAVSTILRRDWPSTTPVNMKRAAMLTGVNSTLSSSILSTTAATDFG